MAANTSKYVYVVWEQLFTAAPAQQVHQKQVVGAFQVLSDAKDGIKSEAGLPALEAENLDVKLNRKWRTEWVLAPANGEGAQMRWGIDKVKFK